MREDADLKTLTIYCFRETQHHRGWYRGENVVSWSVLESRRLVEQDGLEIQVNQSGMVQRADSEHVKVHAGMGIFCRQGQPLLG
jgi:hypothetical protein